YVKDAPLEASGTGHLIFLGDLLNDMVASFSDANPNPDINDFSAFIYWGDGTPIDPFTTIESNATGAYDVSGSHYYLQPAVYFGTVYIRDYGGSNAFAPLVVTVAAYSPFNPSRPIAYDDAYSMIHDRTLRIAANGVLTNDVNSSASYLAIGPRHGTV